MMHSRLEQKKLIKMSGKVYVISDLHHGHENLAKKRGFSSAKEQDDLIELNWNKTVNKGDTVYILGDITMENKNYEFLSRLKGYKNVVLGNHDMRNHVPEMLKYVNSVAGMIDFKDKIILTHCPIHQSQLAFRYKFNIHGHIHEDFILYRPHTELSGEEEDKRYINVCCEKINYTPVEINSLMQKKQLN
jgi:calcineurin-like phosphoesterase family protein